MYFAPSLILATGVAAAVWSMGNPKRLRTLALVGLALETLIARRALRDGAELSVAAALPAVVVATHAAYGAAFLRGLLTPSIEDM